MKKETYHELRLCNEFTYYLTNLPMIATDQSLFIAHLFLLQSCIGRIVKNGKIGHYFLDLQLNLKLKAEKDDPNFPQKCYDG